MSFLSTFALTHGLLADFRADPHPTVLHAWHEDTLKPGPVGTHFGFVQQGRAQLHCTSGTFLLKTGMYFAVPGPMSIEAGRGLVVTRQQQQAFFHLGGPIEVQGRLRYIDGCTDSLLIPPIERGDACLNLLHLPPGTRQTPHTHPSLRVGLVVRGAGVCVTPDERVPLRPGLVFVLPAGRLHCFHTDATELLVVAYHPDSDFGPKHEDHPMRNRTIIPDSREEVAP